LSIWSTPQSVKEISTDGNSLVYPTHGDGRYLGTTIGGQAMTYPYLCQIAQAIDHLGYTGALLPTGRSCEDAWVVASSLISVTERMRFL